jgi:radical SAM-linked protein
MDEIPAKAPTVSAAVSRQRLRITFARDETLRYIGHLDMARTWQRILRRAELPLAYSEGFNPQPKITFAGALPVGCTSDHEVMDIVLATPCRLDEVRTQLERAVPPGIQLVSLEEVPVRSPALQTQLVAAEYEIVIEGADSIVGLAERVSDFLDADEILRERRGKHYNLRPLVQALTVEQAANRAVIRSRLQTSESGTGRPDELVAALGLDPATAKIRRTKLIFLDKTN